jgi:2-polyprenyl-3-methyl-5-hydroxy-6-metoxy-1,4-benzoquinol methylase
MSAYPEVGEVAERNGQTGVDQILAAMERRLVSDGSPRELEYYLIHHDRYRFILEQVAGLALPPGAEVLDVGCYPPHLFSALVALGFRVSGISSRHEKVDLENVVSINIEAEQLPYADQSFDLVVFTEIIEHMTLDPRRYLGEIRRVLRPGGRLLITTPNSVNLKNRAKLLVGRSVYFSLEQLYDTHPDDDSIYFRHNREFTLGELRAVVRAAGFEVPTAAHFNAYGPFRERVKRQGILVRGVKLVGWALTHLHPSLKDSLYLVADPAAAMSTGVLTKPGADA